jgi:HPt (histidine-containing phosphotransfer) domain-containing protein
MDGCDIESIPPQVMELNQLIHEAQEYIQGLDNTECYVTSITRQLLEECPASKLSRLSVQIQHAEARMQMGKAIVLLKKENRDEVDLLKKQMEQLQQSIADLKQVNSYEQQQHSDSLEAKETHELQRATRNNNKRSKLRLLIQKVWGNKQQEEAAAACPRDFTLRP